MSSAIHPTTRRALIALTSVLTLGALSACEKKAEIPVPNQPAPRDPNTPQFATTTGLATPESVLWDSTRGIWYVSNINGDPTKKDDNGYIVRLNENGTLLDTMPFINGADADIKLDAPKGMGLKGDTLWVADIDRVRAFDVNTGNQVADVSLAGLRATFLNDVAVGNDGGVYITDSGIAFKADGSVTHPGKSRVFVVRNNAASEAVVLPKESAANGIAWNTSRNAWLIVGFNTKDIYEWVPGAKQATVFGSGVGGADGIVVLGSGRALYTSWADSSLTMFEGGESHTFRKNLPSPADLGYDPVRRLIAVPLFNANRVEFWPLEEHAAAKP